jgi:hypothetical protein
VEIKCLNEIIKPLLNIFVNPKINLIDQLSQLAYASHLLLFIYREHKTEFLTFQLYSDIQAIIQDAFKNAELFKANDETAKLILAFLGTDELELLFSSIRTQTHANVCDIVELLERFTIAIQMEDIYNKHPTWRKKSRLSTGLTNDHSNVESWIGNLTTQELDQTMIKLLWSSGAHNAKKYLENLGFIFFEIKNEKVTILNPLGSSNPYKHLEIEPDDLEYEIFNQPLIDDSNNNDFNLINIDDKISQELNTEKSNSTYIYNEKIIHKSNAIANLINCTSRLSKVRETRVFKPSEACFTLNQTNDAVFSENNILLCDVLATIVINSNDSAMYLTLMSIDKIMIGNENKYDINPEFIKDCKLSGTVLQFDTINSHKLIWKNDYIGNIEGIQGSLCCQVKNTLAGVQIEYDLGDLKGLLVLFINVNFEIRLNLFKFKLF